jgi:hypothetical protein
MSRSGKIDLGWSCPSLRGLSHRRSRSGKTSGDRSGRSSFELKRRRGFRLRNFRWKSDESKKRKSLQITQSSQFLASAILPVSVLLATRVLKVQLAQCLLQLSKVGSPALEYKKKLRTSNRLPLVVPEETKSLLRISIEILVVLGWRP